MNSLDVKAEDIANGIVADGLAERLNDEGPSGPYWYLATPGAWEAPFTILAALGSPEVCGVWSYTLLSMGLLEETSMRAYFAAFRQAGLGLVAINPNCNGPDLMGESFCSQLGQAAEHLGNRSFGLLGFSMGGGMALQFIDSDAAIARRVVSLALIDPTLPARFAPRRSREILADHTLLVASDEPMSPGNIASQILDVPAKSYSGLHGEIPHKSLPDVVAYFQNAVK